MNSNDYQTHPLSAMEAAMRSELGEKSYHDFTSRHRRLVAYLTACRARAGRQPDRSPSALPKTE